MKNVVMIITLVMFTSTIAFTQMDGTVSGFVYDSEGNPVEHAMVRLTAEGWHGGHGGGGHGHHL